MLTSQIVERALRLNLEHLAQHPQVARNTQREAAILLEEMSAKPPIEDDQSAGAPAVDETATKAALRTKAEADEAERLRMEQKKAAAAKAEDENNGDGASQTGGV